MHLANEETESNKHDDIINSNHNNNNTRIKYVLRDERWDMSEQMPYAVRIAYTLRSVETEFNGISNANCCCLRNDA